MKRIAILATGALLLSALARDVAAQNGYDLMQQALVQERTAGDVEEAIRLYRQIVDEHASDRALAARALLRLGAAYEKLGRGEATETYQRLLSDYSDQTEQAAQARVRLAALRPPAASESDPSPTRRLVLDRESLVTRDGRHLLRYNHEDRAFELVKIGTSEVRKLTSDGPNVERRHPVDFYLSPDGSRIVAALQVGAETNRPPSWENNGGIELRILDVGDRGIGEKIFTWGPGHHVQFFGWSPDQGSVWVFVMRPDRAAEIGSVELSTGSVEILKTLTWRAHTQDPSLSPDGRFIAYHDADSRNAPPDIFLLAADGSHEVRIEHPASDSKPLFAPDGSGIVFQSNRRNGIRDLWFLPVVDGRPAGEPRLVFADISPYGQARQFAENGSLFYFFATNRWEVYTADLDLAAGTVGEPEWIEPRHGEMNNAPAFSPDGAYLAHLRGRGRRLVLRELATGVEREFPISGSLRIAAIDWCPGGGAVIVTGYSPEWVAFRVDLDRGGAERLPLADPQRALCLGDNDVVYLRGVGQAGSGETTNQLVRRSLATGSEKILFEGRIDPYYPTLQRSPDGSLISFIEMDADEAQLLVMPSAGGDPTPVARGFREPPFTEVQGVMWSPDGESLLVALSVPSGDLGHETETSPEVKLVRFVVDGGAENEVGRMRLPAFDQAVYGARNYSLHPDGTRLAFERHAGLIAQEWAIDNLLQFIQSGAIAVAPGVARQP